MKHLTILTILLISATCGFGQFVKIGQITIDSKTADKYFLDCYHHPDTIQYEGFNTMYFDNNDQQRADERKAAIEKISIGKAYKITNYEAHIDTVWDWFSLGGSGGKSEHSKTYSKIENVPAGSYTDFIGYLVPRKPTEIDFIKWKVKNLIDSK